MAGVDITKERGRVTGVDLKVLRGNHVYMVEKLNAYELINALFQNEVIDQDDMTIITKEHDKSRRQGVEQMLKIIHESGPKAFSGFVKSLRMAGFIDMARRLQEEHRSRIPQQDETATQEPKRGNVKQLTDEFKRRDEEMKDLTRRVGLLEVRSNDVSDKCQSLEEADKNKEREIKELKDNLNDLNKKLEDGDRMKEREIKELKERPCVLEERSSDQFNFAKLPLYPRFNTDGINRRKTVEVIEERIEDWERKTVEDIKERLKDWERKSEVWLKNRKDCLNKLLNWFEEKQYENVEVFKLDVKEWRDVLYKCLVSVVEVLDSCIECGQFLASLDNKLLYRLGRSKNGLFGLIDVYKLKQADVMVEIEQYIESVNQIMSDEGKDNSNNNNNNNEFDIFDYKVDLTSSKTNLVRIYKQLQ